MRVEHAADLAIDPGAQSVVASGRQASSLIVERIVDRVHAMAGLEPGMARMPVLGMQTRRRHLVDGVEVENVLGHRQRKVRRDEADEQHPGPIVVLSRRACQPGLGLRGDAVIIDVVLGGARTDRVEHGVRALGEVRLPIPQSAPDHAVAAVDVHGMILVIEASGVLDIGVVQLADRNRPDGRAAAGRGPSPARCRRRPWRCPSCRARAHSGRLQTRHARARRWANCSRRRRSTCRAPPDDRGSA